MREIVSEEGVKALWKGVGPAMVRAGCLTASQMATYDEAKQVYTIFCFVFWLKGMKLLHSTTKWATTEFSSLFTLGLADVDTTWRRFSITSHVLWNLSCILMPILGWNMLIAIFLCGWKVELHRWNGWYTCDCTYWHDQNKANAATGVQRCQSIQEWFPLCLPGVNLHP